MSVNVDIIVLINVLRIVMLYELFSSLVWKHFYLNTFQDALKINVFSRFQKEQFHLI